MTNGGTTDVREAEQEEKRARKYRSGLLKQMRQIH
jgi:hypothetical protein